MSIAQDPLKRIATYKYKPQTTIVNNKGTDKNSGYRHYYPKTYAGTKNKKLFTTTLNPKNFNTKENAAKERMQHLIEATKHYFNEKFPGAWERAKDQLIKKSKEPTTQKLYQQLFGKPLTGLMTRSEAEKMLVALILGFSSDIASNKEQFSEYFSKDPRKPEKLGTIEDKKDYHYSTSEMRNEKKLYQLCIPIINGNIDIGKITGDDDQIIGSYISKHNIVKRPRQSTEKGQSQFKTGKKLFPDFPLHKAEPAANRKFFNNSDKVYSYEIGFKNGHFEIRIAIYPAENNEVIAEYSTTKKTLVLSGKAADEYMQKHYIEKDVKSGNPNEPYQQGFARVVNIQKSAFNQFFEKLYNNLHRRTINATKEAGSIAKRTTRRDKYFIKLKKYVTFLKKKHPTIYNSIKTKTLLKLSLASKKIIKKPITSQDKITNLTTNTVEKIKDLF